MLKLIPNKKPNQQILQKITKLLADYPELSLGERKAVERALVVTKKGLTLKINEKYLHWHPGLLHTLREAGESHPWVVLGEIKKGDHILDCTLGLGTDARFLSEITQEQVIGLENNLGIFLLTQEGLSQVEANVTVYYTECLTFLKEQDSNSFDIVIADPMFPKHLLKPSHGLDLVRYLATASPLDHHWLTEAKRVARRRVLMKDHRDNDLLERLNADQIWSKGKRHTRYGSWVCC